MDEIFHLHRQYIIRYMLCSEYIQVSPKLQFNSHLPEMLFKYISRKLIHETVSAQQEQQQF